MVIKTTQKIIKIGTSAGVTFPARELKRAGLKPGDMVEIAAKRLNETTGDVLAEYAAFKAQYSETLKNLANR